MTATTALSALRRPGTPSGCRLTRWGRSELPPCARARPPMPCCTSVFSPLRPWSLHSYKFAVLHSHTRCNASRPQVILLSDDADNRQKAEEMGVTALSSAAYARQRAAEGQAELQVGWCMWPHCWLYCGQPCCIHQVPVGGANVLRCSRCNVL